jgi:hypothetical protein
MRCDIYASINDMRCKRFVRFDKIEEIKIYK